MQKSKWVTPVAIALLILSCVLFGLIFVVPFLPLSLAQKGIFVTVLVIGMEITWWVGLAMVGKQLISKYRKYLNPCHWFSRNTASAPAQTDPGKSPSAENQVNIP